jgi:putative CocE/NonD family hydrolase
MKKVIGVNKMLVPIVALVVLLGALAFFLYARQAQANQGVVSEFGVYHGYTPRPYDGYRRVSDYLTLSDGTRVAYDLILPTKSGVPAGEPLPVLFKYTPYMRAWTVYDKNGKSNVAELEDLAWYEEGFLRLRSWLAPNGNTLDPMWRTKWLDGLVKSGYAVVVAERPGTGASFGTYDASDAAMAREANDILNWIAAQAWCDGNIGMYGDSVQGQVQLAAASTGNPHLKALFVESTWMDVYQSFMYPGGIYDKSFGDFYVWSQKLLDSAMITPVDRDTDGSLLAQARAERRSGMTAIKLGTTLAAYPFRDSLTPQGRRYWDNAALYPLMERINQAGVPVYLINGWYDPLARENFLIYANLTAPKRMLVRAADHSQADDPGDDVDYAAEAQRWFDTWLKGVDNGIMQEPPIHYYLQGVSSQTAWQVTDVWPPKNGEMTRYYFGAGAAPHAGTLVPTPPAAGEAFDAYTVDYTTTTGPKARWTAVNWAHEYPNMRANDAKALSYTTPPLEAAVQVVGHPVVHLWLSSDAPDLDVFAYLEEVDGSGNSTYVTEGNLRASHRAMASAPYDNLGLPYRNHFQSEVTPIPAGEPVELVFDLLPTAYRFGAGKQLRVTVAFADADNFDTPILNPAPALQLLRNAGQPSYVELPLVNE